MTARRRTVALVGVVARASSQLATFVITLVSMQYLGPAEFGSFAVASAILLGARNFLYSGPFEFLLKAPRARRCEGDCLAVSGTLASAAMLLLLIVCLGLHLAGHGGVTQSLILLLAFTLPLAAAVAWMESLLLRELALRRYYSITIATEAAAALLAITLFLSGVGLMTLVIHQYARGLLMGSLYAWQLRRRVIPSRSTLAGIREVLGWSSHRYGSTVAQFASNYSGDFLLAAFHSPAATGLYRAGNRIASAVGDIFAQPLRTMAMTSVSQRAAAGMAPDGQVLLGAAAFATAAWPAFITLALLADLIAAVALSPAWTASAPVIAIVALARCLSLIDCVNGATLVAYDRQRRLLRIQVQNAVLGAVLIATLSIWGIVGAAVGTLCAAIALSLALGIEAHRLGALPAAQLRQATRIVAPAVVATGLGTLAGRTLALAQTSSEVIVLGAALAGAAAGWLASVAVSWRQLMAALDGLHPAAAGSNALVADPALR